MTMLWRSVSTVARSLVRPIGSRQLANGKISPSVTAAIPQSRSDRLSHHQASLPGLPVPTLEATTNKFLETVRPLVSDDEFQHTQQLVSDFQRPESTAHRLQSLLKERASNTDNWLSEWWMNIAYLEFRMPVVVHVSPGIMLPSQNFKGVNGQIKTAAKMLTGALDYRAMLDNQEIPVDKLGGSPLCMNQYYMMLSTCRVPGAKRDSMVNYPGGHPKSPKHVTVIHNNHFFSVPVYGSDGSPLTTTQLIGQLQNVVNQSQERGPALGILGTDNRDNWYKAYKALSKDKRNRGYFDEIQGSMLVLCLDQSMSHGQLDDLSNALMQVNNGGGSKHNSANRWPDKTLQLVVSPDGNIGAAYEHATAEGPPVLSILEHIMKYVKKDVDNESGSSKVESPRRLDFTIPSDVTNMIQSSSQALDTLLDDLELRVFKFEGYGKNLIKSHKMSPDAFIQIAFQLAYYKLYGHSAATYESGSLRRFIKGRTDTIRSCSNTSHAYCQAMVDSDVPVTEKVNKLRDAINAHRKYTDGVVKGEGIDRHFLGLKLTAIENGIDLPSLFMDPVFESSCYWKLSTSQVASPSGGLLGFGPVVPDGYGICYNPMNDYLMFAITAWNSCPGTSTDNLRDALNESLLDAQNILSHTSNANL